MTIKASKLESGGSVRLESALGEIALLTDTSSTFNQVKKTGSNVVWQSTRDKGNADQTVEHTEITATGPIQVLAAQGIRVEYRDTGNVDDSITQLAKQPGLAWMEQLRSDPKVNWQAVAEAHQKWDYKSEGLTGAGAALLSLAVAVATYGVGSGFDTFITGALAESLGATGAAMVGAAAEAGFASLCSQAAVGLVNNKGDLLATLQGLASDQGMRALASAMLTASLTSGGLKLAGLDPSDAAKAGDAAKNGTNAGQQAATAATTGQAIQDAITKAAITGTVQAGVGTALYGGDLGQNLLDSMRGVAVDALGAKAANEIGEAAARNDLDYVTHKIAHAALGGAMAAADGKDAASGALGAVVGEITAEELSGSLENAVLSGEIGPDTVQKWGARNVDLAKLTAGLAAAAVGLDVNTAAQTGGNAAQNNVGHILAALAATAAVLAVVAEFADKSVQVYNVIEFYKAYKQGDMVKAEEYATELAWSLGTDAIPGNAVLAKIFNSVGLVALGTKIGQKVEKVAKIVLPKSVIKLSEANITNSGRTVLGSFPGYIQQAKATGSSYFDIGNTWNDLSNEQRWAANVHFLDTIAAKGDVVNISTAKAAIRSDSILADEIRHLINNRGYQWAGPNTLRKVK